MNRTDFLLPSFSGNWQILVMTRLAISILVGISNSATEKLGVVLLAFGASGIADVACAFAQHVRVDCVASKFLSALKCGTDENTPTPGRLLDLALGLCRKEVPPAFGEGFCPISCASCL